MEKTFPLFQSLRGGPSHAGGVLLPKIDDGFRLFSWRTIVKNLNVIDWPAGRRCRLDRQHDDHDRSRTVELEQLPLPSRFDGEEMRGQPEEESEREPRRTREEDADQRPLVGLRHEEDGTDKPGQKTDPAQDEGPANTGRICDNTVRIHARVMT